jgi:hypothetical protein
MWAWIAGVAAVAVIAIVCALVFVVLAGDDGQEASGTTTTLSAASTTETTGEAAATTETTAPEVTTTAPTAPATSTTVTAAPDTSGPEQVVMELFDALENLDIDALLGLMDPRIVGALPEGEAMDAFKAALSAQIESLGSMEFSGIELSTEMTSDTTATVTVTAGTVTVRDAEGQVTSEDVSEASSPVTISLIKVDGKWYVESSPFV